MSKLSLETYLFGAFNKVIDLSAIAEEEHVPHKYCMTEITTEQPYCQIRLSFDKLVRQSRLVIIPPVSLGNDTSTLKVSTRTA